MSRRAWKAKTAAGVAGLAGCLAAASFVPAAEGGWIPAGILWLFASALLVRRLSVPRTRRASP